VSTQGAPKYVFEHFSNYGIIKCFLDWKQYQVELDPLTAHDGDAAAEKHFRNYRGEVLIDMPIEERARRHFVSGFRCINPGLGSCICDFIRKYMSYIHIFALP
jgi:hypothetical protein